MCVLVCVLAGRLDSAKHYFMTGGAWGLRESFKTLASRVLSFNAYNFDLSKYQLTRKLFGSEKFQKLAKSVCPADRQVVDPFQFNFIIQVPGQTVATHIDGVYFWGATRFQYPQWLLSAMKFSGLFEQEFIPQVQVVGYLHRWDPRKFKVPGSFIYWSTKEPEVVQPVPRAGVACDGTRTIHAAQPYRPEVMPPVIDKNIPNELVFKENDRWELVADGKAVRNYTTEDFRISIVYRGRCFHSQDEVDRFAGKGGPDTMELDDILSRFGRDLVQKKLVPSVESVLKMDRLELSMLILDTYISYPHSPRSFLPLNYCMLDTVMPWLAPVVNFVCQGR